MKNLLKKLHIMSNPSDDAEGSTSLRGNNNSKSNELASLHNPEPNINKPTSGLSNWLNSVVNRKSPSPPSSSNVKRAAAERTEPADSVNVSCLDVALETKRLDSESNNSRDPDVEEEYQIQMALELSAKEDPEAVQIEAVKQISLGSCDPENTPAEVVAYRYWNYNSLSYDDKIMDGFYDLYGIPSESTSDRMPSLVDLQGTPVSGSVMWEAVLVNRAADSNLLKLEQKVLEVAVKSRSHSQAFVGIDLVRNLAVLVADYMGGPVGDPENMSRASRSLSYSLKGTLGSMVLPLGSLTIGLARHRALLFKVLADSVGIPCRLVKGQQYTGCDDVAMNFVRIDDGREYIVDLMADPGTLIPSDAVVPHVECDDSFYSASPLSRDIDSSHAASSSSGVGSSFEEHSEFGTCDKRSRFRNSAAVAGQSNETGKSNAFFNLTRTTEGEEELKMLPENKHPSDREKAFVRELPNKPNYPHAHARSPSWTEGVSSPAAHRMKVKDVSQYMIDAAKENPQLAQKLHDVLLESGVVAPPNLFTEIYAEQLDASTVEVRSPTETQDKNKQGTGSQERKNQDDPSPARFLPPLPRPRAPSKATSFDQPEEDLGLSRQSDVMAAAGQPLSPQSEATPIKYRKDVPVAAAAAAAAAAVVASSMVVAVAKSNTDSNLELPVAAAATATAAAMVATTAAVGKQYELSIRSDGDADSAGYEPRDSGSGGREHNYLGANSEGERVSDRSASNDSSKSDVGDDVAECEIPWEEITLGERIGLGSYGEVYRGDWHGTARGMNYLHNCTPVIVHRDLKSPNLLVDKNWVVKAFEVTFTQAYSLTKKSLPAMWCLKAEWMAPEVLRNEPSDEKCDVYSFGVILWELCTMQQPWGGMNPMQVVGAVGFQHRRLDIPDNLDPAVADIIRKCWQTDPKMRPTFTEIMAALKPLQKPITSSQVPRPVPSLTGLPINRGKSCTVGTGKCLIDDDGDNPTCTPVEIVILFNISHSILHKMATFFGSPTFLSHPITTTHQFSSSQQAPPPPPPPSSSNQPSQPQSPTPSPQLSTASSEQPAPAAKVQQQKRAKPATVESTDWIASSLTRRFGLGAGLAWAGFLAVGVISEQIKTRLEVSQQEASTRNVEKEEEVVLPNGIRYYELKVGGGATPRRGDLVVIDLRGEVEGSGQVFVDTFGGNKKPLALVMGSRPYGKGMCEGIEYVLRSMKVGGKRRVIIPPNLAFGANGADLGDGVQIPPFATLEYIVEVEKVSIAPA
ncbi:putative serine/threonine-protein kinase SIS8 [Citrus sinensis]|nr:putative serine/threonine-protein kinase SIS8 [Citrus sinensis]